MFCKHIVTLFYLHFYVFKSRRLPAFYRLQQNCNYIISIGYNDHHVCTKYCLCPSWLISPLTPIDQIAPTYIISIAPGAAFPDNPFHYYPQHIAIPVGTTVEDGLTMILVKYTLLQVAVRMILQIVVLFSILVSCRLGHLFSIHLTRQ